MVRAAVPQDLADGAAGARHQDQSAGRARLRQDTAHQAQPKTHAERVGGRGPDEGDQRGRVRRRLRERHAALASGHGRRRHGRLPHDIAHHRPNGPAAVAANGARAEGAQPRSTAAGSVNVNVTKVSVDFVFLVVNITNAYFNFNSIYSPYVFAVAY